MANPLKELPLAAHGFQFIQELPIEATPARVWAALTNINGWFLADPDPTYRGKNTLELFPGGKWCSERKDGTVLFNAFVSYIEPQKLLRLWGPFGMTHLPVSSVVIFELQPRHDGRTTLLRLGQRTFGFIDPEAEQRFQGGWNKMLPRLKELAEQN
jgi:uncharacterized protein YndB with AHSA1/START domain